MLNNEQIDLLYRVLTKQTSEMNMEFLSETVRDGTAEGEFTYLLVRGIVKPKDFQEEMFKVISEIITKEALTSILKKFFKLTFSDNSHSNEDKVADFINDLVVYTFEEYFNLDVCERLRLSDNLGFYDYGKLCRFIQTYPDYKDMDSDTLRWRGFTFYFDCNNVDFENFINYEELIRSIPSIVRYVDIDRLIMLPSKDRCLTVREVLKLGVTHKNLRELDQDFFEGLSEREFNDYVNSNLDDRYYDVIIRDRDCLKEYLVNKLLGEN